MTPQTALFHDARGRVYAARAICSDGKVRRISVRGKAARYYKHVGGWLRVDPQDGRVYFVEGNPANAVGVALVTIL